MNETRNMKELTFGDIKKMGYNDNLPFNFVLVDLLYKKQIDVNFVLSRYIQALETRDYILTQCGSTNK